MTTNQRIDGVPRELSVSFTMTRQQERDILRFYDTCEDGQGYDVPKDRMKSLARLGLIRPTGFSRYEITDAGDAVIEKLRALLDAPVCGLCGKPTVCGKSTCEDCAYEMPAAQPQGEPVACAHDWLDDGEYLIVCTKCGAKENHDPCWRDMASAPTDGTMVRLLVEFEEHSTEDADQAPTIGANNFDNDGENVWRFAGWCWSHDHFTEGKGTPVGWLPMLPDPICTPASTI